MRRRHPNIRTVILTGASDGLDTIVARTIREGCDGFLSKADDADSLIDVVRRAHAGEAVFSPDAITRATRLLQTTSTPSTLSHREPRGAHADGHGRVDLRSR